MTTSAVSYESCFDACAGTPGKMGRAIGKRERTPAADRFIPQRSAMDLDVSHFELTREHGSNSENASVNASPAKEEYKKELAATLLQTERPTNKCSRSRTRRRSPPTTTEVGYGGSLQRRGRSCSRP